jgi:hypothetical protein
MSHEHTQERSKRPGIGRPDIAIICCLIALTLAVFLQTTSFSLCNFDDNNYISNNPRVLEGLTVSGVRWAFTTFYEANWHPLTWLSFMLDAHIGGLVGAFGIDIGDSDAGMYHLTNVVLHTANVVLLFVLFNSMTGMRWRSAFVAALFAVHPLHVESVAWVTERKDVLSTLFWLLTMLAYLRYVSRPDRARHAMLTAVFALGLMAKPMLVSLPIVLLLIDIWPLGRLDLSNLRRTRRDLPALLREKVPLFALALCSCVVTFLAQRYGGSVVEVEGFPVLARLLNALVSYSGYVRNMLLPTDLAVFYPMRMVISLRQIVPAAFFFTAATALAIRCAGKDSLRWITVGWFWYVITLLPVIGILQVGLQAMADRYTYVPLIGLFVIVAWGVPAVAQRLIKTPATRSGALAALGLVAVACLAAQGYAQVGHWKDGSTLFAHNLRVTGSNYYSELFYASALDAAGRPEEALDHYARAAGAKPHASGPQTGMGTALAKMGRYSEALVHMRRAVGLAPGDAKARNNLGGLLLYHGRAREAVVQFEAALRINPDYEGARANLELARDMVAGE